MAEASNEEMITLVDDSGNEELYRVLFTFDSDDYGKSYILLYPVSAEDDEEVDIQAFSFHPKDGDDSANGDISEGELDPIEDDAEWDMVEQVLNTFLDDKNMQ